MSQSGWAPFHNRPFAVMWTATVVSNIGTWMYNLASGWLMLSLDPGALSVSLVQVANTLPMFLLAIPAGALVDSVDRRRFLIVGESAITLNVFGFCGTGMASPHQSHFFAGLHLGGHCRGGNDSSGLAGGCHAAGFPRRTAGRGICQ